MTTNPPLRPFAARSDAHEGAAMTESRPISREELERRMRSSIKRLPSDAPLPDRVRLLEAQAQVDHLQGLADALLDLPATVREWPNTTTPYTQGYREGFATAMRNVRTTLGDPS